MGRYEEHPGFLLLHQTISMSRCLMNFVISFAYSSNVHGKGLVRVSGGRDDH